MFYSKLCNNFSKPLSTTLCFYSIFIYLCKSKEHLIMWIFIEFIITLILVPFIIKWRDWGWLSCFIFI